MERSAILDTSKFVRIAVDWLLMSDIGEMIKKIVDSQAFPDYQVPKKPGGELREGKNAAQAAHDNPVAFFARCRWVIDTDLATPNALICDSEYEISRRCRELANLQCFH